MISNDNLLRLAEEVSMLSSNELWEFAQCLINDYPTTALLLKADIELVDPAMEMLYNE